MNQPQIIYCTVTWRMENVFCLTISVTFVSHIAIGFVSAEYPGREDVDRYVSHGSQPRDKRTGMSGNNKSSSKSFPQ